MTTRPVRKPLVISDDEWARVRDYVVDKAGSFPQAPTSKKQSEYLLAFTRYCLWVLDQGYDLNDEDVFDPEIVEEHMTTFIIEGAQYRTSMVHQSLVRLVLRHLNSDIPQGKSPHVPSNRRAKQWTGPQPLDSETLSQWAGNDRDRLIVLALGLGAGLLNAEILRLTWDDVFADEIGVIVRAGTPLREIPVRTQYDAPLRAGGQGLVFFPSAGLQVRRNLLSSMLKEIPGVLGQQPLRRFRHTLMGELINSGAPDEAICAIAGLTSVAGYESLRKNPPSIMTFRTIVHGVHP